jgi:hypothetical protein
MKLVTVAQRCALAVGGRTNQQNGKNCSPKFAVFAGPTTNPLHAVLARSPKMAESVTALSPWKPIHSEYEPKNHTNGREASDRDCEPIDPTKVVV